MAARGRPSTVGEDAIKAVVSKLKLGLTFGEACQLARVGESSVRRAMRSNEEFRQAIKEAATAGKAHLVGLVNDAANTTWTAAAWMLERKWPQEFARRRPDAYTTEEFLLFASSLMDIARRLIPPERHEDYNAAVGRLLQEMQERARVGRK